MDKSDFLKQFTNFNKLIESALSTQNFDRVVSLDVARRKMLKEFTTLNAPDDDQHLFTALEECAADNARAITQMTEEMMQLQQSTGTKLRGLAGYRI